MADLIPTDPNAVMQKLSEARDKLEGGNSFRLQVFRRDQPSTIPFVFATFDAATIEHFAQPELWMPQLANGGGGYFDLRAYHCSDTSRLIGMIKFAIPNAPLRDPDLTAPARDDWRGPRILLTRPTPQPVDQTISVDQPRAHAPGPAGWRTPVGPPQQQAQQQQQAPAAGDTTFNGAAGSGGEAARLIALNAELSRREKALEAERAAMREDAIRRENALQMQALEQRLAAQQRESDAKFAALLAKLDQPRAPERSPVEPITAVATVVGPMIEKMFSSRADQEAKAALALAEAQKQNQALLLEVMRGKEETFKMVAPMMEAMQSSSAQQSQTMMQLLHTMVEIQPQDPDEPAYLKVIREVLGGLQATMAAQQQTQQQATARVREEAEGTRRRLPPSETKAPPDVPQLLENLIKAKANPERVVALFLRGFELRNPPLMNALKAAGGNPLAMMQSRVQDWVLASTANQQYAMQLAQYFEQRMEELQAGAPAAGEEPEDDDGVTPVRQAASEPEVEAEEEIEDVAAQLSDEDEPVATVEPVTPPAKVVQFNNGTAKPKRSRKAKPATPPEAS